MTARLDSWIRDFADKMPFSSNLAESPMPAVVETRVMKCLQKKKKSFRICIPKYAPGKWRGFPFWGCLRNESSTLMMSRNPKPANAHVFLYSVSCRGLLKQDLGCPVRVDYFSLSTWPPFHQDVLLTSVCSVSQVILSHSWPYVPAFVFKHFPLPICPPGIHHKPVLPSWDGKP